MFRSLAVANYRLWFGGALVSNIGTWMQRIAQDWLVLTSLTNNDAAAVGVTMALQFGPPLLLVPITGLAADRLDRRKLLIVTQVAMGLLGVGLGLITVLGVVQLWMVFAFAFGLGVAAAFDAPARQAFVSELVPEQYLSNAVALNSTSFNAARLIGPAIAGVLVAAIGAGWVFLINSATFAAVIVALALLRPAQFTVFTHAKAGRGGIREGFRSVRGRPDILLVFVMIFITGTLAFNFPIFASTMARVEFHLGAEAFGVLSSALAIGSVTGALLSARRARARLRTVAIAAAATGLSLAIAAVMPSPLLFGAALVLVGFSALTMMTSANGYVQTTTEPALRGRVMALYLAIFMGGTPIGAPLIGWVANAVGIRWAIGLGAASGIVAAGMAAIWFVRVRHLRLSYAPNTRWRVGLSFDGDDRQARELATQEIAVVEVEAQKG